jgi:protein-glutamine gamma-glutamyltransferase
MVILSGVMLAMAEGLSSPSWVTVVVALVAYYFTDSKKTFVLPVWAAGISGTIALLTSIQELMYGDIEARLLSGAHFLIYLNWILLLSKKENQQYWWLFAISLLQTAIGAVLTKESYYPFLLILFMVVQIWTLSLFSLKQIRTGLLKNQDHFNKNKQKTRNISGVESYRELLGGSHQIQNGLNYQATGNWINLRYLISEASLILFSMFVAACFFLFIPRLWIGNFTLHSDNLLSSVSPFVISGYSEKIELKDVSLQLSSNKKVMTLRMFDERTNKIIDVDEYANKLGYQEPLFRGTVLSKYKENKWQSFPILPKFCRPLEPDSKKFNYQNSLYSIRQEIELEPVGSQVLFALQPVHSGRMLNMVDSIRKMRPTQVLYRPENSSKHSPVKYIVYSIPANLQVNKTKIRPPVIKSDPSTIVHNSAFTKELSEIRKLSLKIAGERKIIDQLYLLESYLKDSGEFQYKLNVKQVRKDVDPNIDFLLYRKTGYCENFASALALMIRSLGVPSRVVIGYKGGEVNNISGSYEIEQRHAHAWVEAYINNIWITLDPTPARGRLDSVASMQAQSKTWRDFVEYAKAFWQQNVIDLDFKKQREMIYDPANKISNIIAKEFKKDNFSIISLISAIAGYFFSIEYLRTGFGLISFVIPITCCFILIRLIFSKKWIHQIFNSFKRRKRNKSRKIVKVEFYERFRKMCEKQGIYRTEEQTQLEFATTIHDKWDKQLKADNLEHLPEEIADHYYRIRFGHEELSETVTRNLLEKLKTLETLIKKKSV